MGRYGCEGQISIYDLLEDDATDGQQYLYALIDDSIYELPLFVCDSIEELAEKTNRTVGYINDCIAKAEERGGKSKYLKIKLDNTD